MPAMASVDPDAEKVIPLGDRADIPASVMTSSFEYFKLNVLSKTDDSGVNESLHVGKDREFRNVVRLDNSVAQLSNDKGATPVGTQVHEGGICPFAGNIFT
jgi:hypothetical protein